MSDRQAVAPSFTRRDWLQRVAIPAAALAASACVRDDAAYLVERTTGTRRSRRRFVPVAAEPQRVIRSIVGLRPYRESGIRLESESLQGKQLVHCYGHGGGGMTLSWGTASLAIDQLAGHAPPSQVAVIGAGVVGLSTALLLQRRGFDVTIYTAAPPPHTTSNASAATFYPSHVIDGARVTPAFTALLETALRTSYHALQRLAGERYGIRWLDSYALGSGGAPAGPPDIETETYVKVVQPPSQQLRRDQHPFSATSVTSGQDMVIEPMIYLRALLQDFREAGGRLVIRRFESLRDLASLPQRALFNCTGLGARTLCGDADLKPARGQLCVLPPQPEVDYTLYHGPFYYMVPRQDGIILGGTFDVGVESTTPDPKVEADLITAHARVFDAMK